MIPPIVSVIIPIYNTAATLPRCIDSALSQSFDALEIILVDDGSPDDAGAIADAYADKYEMITVVHQVNAGLAEARRTGILNARGDYVVHLDSDDTMPPDAVAMLYEHINVHKLDMAIGCYNRLVGESEKVVRHHQVGVMDGKAFLMHLLDRRSICASWASMSRRELWHDEVFPPKRLRLPSEDVLMLVFMSRYVGRVGIFNDVVYNYFYNPQSLSILGPLHRQELWKQFFEVLRQNLSERAVLDDTEHLLRIMEIERLAFLTPKIDVHDDWYRRVVSYPSSDFPARVRVLRMLLRCPWIMRWIINANRKVKALINRIA